MNLGAFGLETQVTFFVLNVADAVYELSVNRKLDHSVHADHVVDVPLPPSLAPVLERFATTAPGVVGSRLESACPEEFAMNVGNGRRLFYPSWREA